MSWSTTTWGRRLVALADRECAGAAQRETSGCSWSQPHTIRPMASSNESTAALLLQLSKDDAVVRLSRRRRAFSSSADLSCGIVAVNPDNVTKCVNCRCASNWHGSSGLHVEAGYFLEKLVHCRLQRCIRPCGGRATMFPELLRWNDAQHTLVSRNAGRALALDVHGWDLKFTHEEVAQAAMRNGLPTPAEQFECMRKQLKEAGVVHLDMGCKNLYVQDGALTLGDFDIALVDGFPRERIRQESKPPRSDEDWIWASLKQRDVEWADAQPAGLCFKQSPSQPWQHSGWGNSTAHRAVPPLEKRKRSQPAQYSLMPYV